MKTKYQVLLTIIGGIIFLIVVSSLANYSDNKESEAYFKNSNFDIFGKVVLCEKNNFDSWRIVGLSVEYSKTEIIDPRDSLKRYFILLKDSTAVFYDNGDLRSSLSYEYGDRVKINRHELICTDSLNNLKFKKKIEGLAEFFPNKNVEAMFNKLRKK